MKTLHFVLIRLDNLPPSPQKERNATYQKRWFVLKANLLFYQERPADRHLLGVIVLEGCAVRRAESDGQFTFSLVFEGAGQRSYTLAAVDSPTRESWVKTLQSASHCYLSLLLRDLRGQYEGEPRISIKDTYVHRLSQEYSFLSDFCPPSAEIKKQQPSGESLNNPASTLRPSTSFLPVRVSTAQVREGRSFSAGTVLPPPTKLLGKKSPKVWNRRNAVVTPLNGPAALYSEWPLVDLNPLEDFSKLHNYYGQEVKRAREEWLRSRGAEEERRDLISLS